MSHEQTITIEMDGKHYNIPTVYRGKKISDDEAVDLFKKGKIKSFGTYEDLPSALKAAKERSERTREPSLMRKMMDLFFGSGE